MRIFLTPSIASPLSEARLAPPGAPVDEAIGYRLPDGRVLVLHPSFPAPIGVDSAPECETLRKLADAIHAALPTREARAIAGRLTDADRAELAAEERAAVEAKAAEEQAAAEAAAKLAAERAAEAKAKARAATDADRRKRMLAAGVDPARFPQLFAPEETAADVDELKRK